MAYIESEGIIDCGVHTVAASWTALDVDNPHGFRMLTFRHQTSGTALNWGVKDVNGAFKEGPHLKADESWTFGPSAGTIRTTQIFIKGTAGERVTYGGIIV